MSSQKPVLVSISGSWQTITERPVVGKDVLELLSSSMYVDPLSIYREYVQNAADSIEEALALGLLGRRDAGAVNIDIDPRSRSIRIRDNGTGLSKQEFTRTLIALGASHKRGTKARGFRGVGRLAGLGYCRELVFRSKVEEEAEINEMRWDCQRLKTSLRDVDCHDELHDLVKSVVRVQKAVAPELPCRFFEVELIGVVRHRDDRLMNIEEVRNYLAQVAPVPFSPEFGLGSQINEMLGRTVNLSSINIHLNGEAEPLYRPHRDRFEARKGVIDCFENIEFVDLLNNEGEVAAKGWVLHHGYYGAIDNAALIKGIRLRTGNMQIGEANLLDDLFTEPRFNSWTVGEIHILDGRILPNGRRDHFEQNSHYNNLTSQLRPLALRFSKNCRVSSIRRNILRQCDSVGAQILTNFAVLRQGAISEEDRRRVQQNTSEALTSLEKLSQHSSLQTLERSRICQKLQRYRSTAKKIGLGKKHRALKGLKAPEQAVLTRLCSLIYECSSNRATAKKIIDQVLSRY